MISPATVLPVLTKHVPKQPRQGLSEPANVAQVPYNNPSGPVPSVETSRPTGGELRLK